MSGGYPPQGYMPYSDPPPAAFPQPAYGYIGGPQFNSYIPAGPTAPIYGYQPPPPPPPPPMQQYGYSQPPPQHQQQQHIPPPQQFQPQQHPQHPQHQHQHQQHQHQHQPPPQQPPTSQPQSQQHSPPQQPFAGGYADHTQYASRPTTGMGYIDGSTPSPSSIIKPPQTPQQFGGGAPHDYAFQYSQCTGRRKALLIGINYFGQRGQLRGCINDVRNMSSYLAENFGYRREDMVILTDDQQNAMSQPTKENILRAMHWLVKDARPNDSLFFHYSGHGGQTRDLDGDEDDGYDEVIYPVDFRTRSHITDDEMHRIMVRPLQAGVRLTAIFDSCHSGTALDLPYIYSTQGILKQPNLAKEAGQGLLSAISAYSQGDMSGVANNIMGFFKKASSGDDAQARSLATKTSPADVIMLSGSKDDQTSADATIASQSTGAMSWAFISSLKKNPQQSYVQLLNSIRDELACRYTQRPQLSSSHPLDTNLLFVM